jgi:hypothetical protein
VADGDASTCGFAEFSGKWRSAFSHIRGGSQNRTAVRNLTRTRPPIGGRPESSACGRAPRRWPAAGREPSRGDRRRIGVVAGVGLPSCVRVDSRYASRILHLTISNIYIYILAAINIGG